jgi:16S rRNA processing protein RimM
MVGQIVSAHGLDGTLKILPTTDFPERWGRWRELTVDRLGQARAVVHCRVQADAILLKLEGIVTRDDALALRGGLVMVPESALPPLAEGTYYWYQLIGLTVKEQGSERVLGQVVHILRTGAAHDVLEICRPGRKNLLIPALKSVVQGVDLQAGIMWVTLLPGLEDAAE